VTGELVVHRNEITEPGRLPPVENWQTTETQNAMKTVAEKPGAVQATAGALRVRTAASAGRPRGRRMAYQLLRQAIVAAVPAVGISLPES
jgi:hypothetical protein